MIETIKFIFSILPLVIDLSRELEARFPDSNLGKLKSSLVLEAIQSVGDSEKNMAIVQKVIDSVVSVFNKFGIFKK